MLRMDIEKMSLGGESGIRNLREPMAAASYRLLVAAGAKFATDAVEHCPKLLKMPKAQMN